MGRFGVIFDMDGVLVESGPALRKAAVEVLRGYGVRAEPADFDPFSGMGEEAMIRGVAEQAGVAYRPEMKQRVYELYCRRAVRDVRVYPGVLAAFDTLRKNGCALALASSADRVKVNANLSLIGASLSDFDAAVTGSEVARKKPDPAIFLLAARRLGLAPADCAVVEDSVSGVRAAKAAGMASIAVETSVDPGRMRRLAGPDRIVPDVAAAPAALLELKRRAVGV